MESYKEAISILIRFALLIAPGIVSAASDTQKESGLQLLGRIAGSYGGVLAAVAGFGSGVKRNAWAEILHRLSVVANPIGHVYDLLKAHMLANEVHSLMKAGEGINEEAEARILGQSDNHPNDEKNAIMNWKNIQWEYTLKELRILYMSQCFLYTVGEARAATNEEEIVANGVNPADNNLEQAQLEDNNSVNPAEDNNNLEQVHIETINAPIAVEPDRWLLHQSQWTSEVEHRGRYLNDTYSGRHVLVPRLEGINKNMINLSQREWASNMGASIATLAAIIGAIVSYNKQGQTQYITDSFVLISFLWVVIVGVLRSFIWRRRKYPVLLGTRLSTNSLENEGRLYIKMETREGSVDCIRLQSERLNSIKHKAIGCSVAIVILPCIAASATAFAQCPIGLGCKSASMIGIPILWGLSAWAGGTSKVPLQRSSSLRRAMIDWRVWWFIFVIAYIIFVGTLQITKAWETPLCDCDLEITCSLINGQCFAKCEYADGSIKQFGLANVTQCRNV